MRSPGQRIRLVCVALAAAMALLPPAGAAGKASGKPATRTGRSTTAAARPASPALKKARAELASVKNSPAKRRYRHNWERAIRALEQAARGPDTGPALLDAARARYALYRFSAIESDREAALRLANRAARAGATQATSLAAAIRREAGDEPGTVAKAYRRLTSPPHVAAPPVRRVEPPPVPPSTAGDDEEPLDPVLEEAVAEARDPAPEGAPVPGGPGSPPPT